MTYRIKNVSQPFDVEGTAKVQVAQFISGNIQSSLSLLNGTHSEHAPWVCVGGAESEEPATPVQNIEITIDDAAGYWPPVGSESLPLDTE